MCGVGRVVSVDVLCCRLFCLLNMASSVLPILGVQQHWFWVHFDAGWHFEGLSGKTLETQGLIYQSMFRTKARKCLYFTE